MLPLWYGGSMSYYVYDGSGLSAVCSSVLSFCLHACKLWYDLSFVYYVIEGVDVCDILLFDQ